jgi:hypothetical protein
VLAFENRVNLLFCRILCRIVVVEVTAVTVLCSKGDWFASKTVKTAENALVLGVTGLFAAR